MNDQIWRTILLHEDFLYISGKKEKHPSRKMAKEIKRQFTHTRTQTEMMTKNMKKFNLQITQEM